MYVVRQADSLAVQKLQALKLRYYLNVMLHSQSCVSLHTTKNLAFKTLTVDFTIGFT